MAKEFIEGALSLKSGQLVYAKRAGSGKTYIVLHGFSGDHLGMLEFAALLPAQSEVIVLDLPGFGGSSDPAEPARHSLALYVKFLNSVINRLVTTPKVVLVGHSFGATVGFAYMAIHPKKVQHFIAICPVVSKRLPARWLGWLSQEVSHRVGFEATRQVLAWPPAIDLATRYLLADTPKNRYELIRQQRLREAKAFRPAMLAIGSLTNTFAAEYAKVQLSVPVTLILASHDNIAGKHDGAWFAARCAILQAVTMSGNHLLPCVEPHKTAQAVRRIIKRSGRV